MNQESIVFLSSYFMDNFALNKKIISAIKQQISKNETVAGVLIDLLPLSKESIYRRLRGEITFTFEEIIKISNRFGVSIDDIVDSGVVSTKWITLNMYDFFSLENYFERYFERLDEKTEIIHNIHTAKNSNFRSACNTIPHPFIMSYMKLSQLWHYKWNYLTKGASPNFALSNMILPEGLIDKEIHYAHILQEISHTAYILDQNIFAFTVNDIRYFLSQKLISNNELQQLKQELLDVISDMEILSETGCYKSGMNVMLFLSKINIDGSYYYFEYDKKHSCSQRIFYVDRFDIKNEKFSIRQKEWIDSLKRTSTLLTQSGDRIRFDFFEDQRKLVKSL